MFNEMLRTDAEFSQPNLRNEIELFITEIELFAEINFLLTEIIFLRWEINFGLRNLDFCYLLLKFLVKLKLSVAKQNRISLTENCFCQLLVTEVQTLQKKK